LSRSPFLSPPPLSTAGQQKQGSPHPEKLSMWLFNKAVGTVRSAPERLARAWINKELRPYLDGELQQHNFEWALEHPEEGSDSPNTGSGSGSPSSSSSEASPSSPSRSAGMMRVRVSNVDLSPSRLNSILRNSAESAVAAAWSDAETHQRRENNVGLSSAAESEADAGTPETPLWAELVASGAVVVESVRVEELQIQVPWQALASQSTRVVVRGVRVKFAIFPKDDGEQRAAPADAHGEETVETGLLSRLKSRLEKLPRLGGRPMMGRSSAVTDSNFDVETLSYGQDLAQSLIASLILQDGEEFPGADASVGNSMLLSGGERQDYDLDESQYDSDDSNGSPRDEQSYEDSLKRTQLEDLLRTLLSLLR
jgi:hypothetical protein